MTDRRGQQASIGQVGWMAFAYLGPVVGLLILAPTLVLLINRRDERVRDAAGEALRIQLLSFCLGFLVVCLTILFVRPSSPEYFNVVAVLVPGLLVLVMAAYSIRACVRSIRPRSFA